MHMMHLLQMRHCRWHRCQQPLQQWGALHGCQETQEGWRSLANALHNECAAVLTLAPPSSGGHTCFG